MEKQENNIIMVIEDETPLLLAIQKKLEHSGFETITARDGNQALDYLQSMDQPPSLIWLDYYLPSMNGLEFLRRLKGIAKLKDIPVFVISNTASPEKVDAMMELGAKKYFLKAEKRLDQIITEIRSFLKKGEKK